MPRRNPVLLVVTAELARLGIQWSVEQRGKHLAVRYLDHCQIIPATPSDSRAPVAARAWTRRVIRREGAPT
jgi:hypothetical protein